MTPHDLPLISTIAMGLSTAFVCGLIAVKLKIPPIVGFLLAGIILGPHSPGYVADIKIAEELSEIGIVLLMFGVGLHFSVKDLMEVRRIALPGALVQIAAATALGALMACWWWEWNLAAGIMFGLTLSVASTVVLLRALEENNLLQTTNGRIAIGWLIVEDLAMIVALVLIPALADVLHDGGTPAAAAQNLGIAIGKVILFIMIMLVVGRRFLPWLLMAVTRTRSRELFTLAVFAVAVGIAFGAVMLFGVSFALGAFFAGMMIRESDMNHEVADRALPFQDAFAVLFFVAVGMLFNPAVLIDEPLGVLATVAVIIIGKSLAALAIVLISGYPLKTGLLVSAGLAQIGEFSFILASLGLAHGLMPEEGRDIILAAALISVGLNPLIFYSVRVLHRFVERKPRLSTLFNMRDTDLSQLRGDEKQALRELVILAGYGRVGQFITQHVSPRHDLVIIDPNRERIDTLRNKGFHAIAGDAGHEGTLKEAAIHKALAVIVAVPDSFEARRIVEAAQKIRPGIRILVRAHNQEEMDFFNRMKVDLAVSGPQEMGRRMLEYLDQIKAASPS